MPRSEPADPTPSTNGARHDHCHRPRGDTIIASTDDPVVVEGNVYFPEHDIADGVLVANKAKSLCFWKGIASYYDVAIDGIRLPGAAFTYRHPSPLARRIKGRVAFWNGVDVSTDRVKRSR